MIIVPWRSDAPLYHGPWGTIGLMVANIAAFVAAWPGSRPDWEAKRRFTAWWVLPYGEGFTPLRWLTSAFAHAGVMHLVGNLVFLWTFGLVVEGKLGWKRFLPLYLACAAFVNIAEQAIMWGADSGGSLGASSAIAAMMAMAWLWAPRNEMDVFVWFFRPASIEMPIWAVCVLFVGFDLFSAFAQSFTMTTPALHLLGVAVGAAAGIAALRWRLVDCEGWDLLTIMRDGKPRPTPASRPRAADPPIDPVQRRAQAAELAREYLDAGELDLALRVIDAAALAAGPWSPTGALAADLAEALERADRGDDALIRVATARAAADDDRLRLIHARVLVERFARPTSALAVLDLIDPAALDATRAAELERLRIRGRDLRAAGVMELLD